MGKTICSPCGGQFKDHALYLDHECKKADGAKPTEPDYLKKTTMPNYTKVAEAALKRGADKKAKK